MKLFIWEGNGISSAYDDNGTLAVLAETVEAARLLVREEKERLTQIEQNYEAAANDWKAHHPKPSGVFGPGYWNRLQEAVPYPSELDEPQFGYGVGEAPDREPDRIVELDVPIVVVSRASDD